MGRLQSGVCTCKYFGLSSLLLLHMVRCPVDFNHGVFYSVISIWDSLCMCTVQILLTDLLKTSRVVLLLGRKLFCHAGSYSCKLPLSPGEPLIVSILRQTTVAMVAADLEDGHWSLVSLDHFTCSCFSRHIFPAIFWDCGEHWNRTGVVLSSIVTLLQISCGLCPWYNFENLLVFDTVTT